MATGEARWRRRVIQTRPNSEPAQPGAWTQIDSPGGMLRETEVAFGHFHLAPDSIEKLKERGFTNDELYKIVAPRRTLARRKALKQNLTSAETDRVLRLERISNMADRVFRRSRKGAALVAQAKPGTQRDTHRSVTIGDRRYSRRRRTAIASTTAFSPRCACGAFPTSPIYPAGAAWPAQVAGIVKNTPVVYCADHPATALLEILVHVDAEDLPPAYQLLEIEVPDTHSYHRSRLAIKLARRSGRHPATRHEFHLGRHTRGDGNSMRHSAVHEKLPA